MCQNGLTWSYNSVGLLSIYIIKWIITFKQVCPKSGSETNHDPGFYNNLLLSSLNLHIRLYVIGKHNVVIPVLLYVKLPICSGDTSVSQSIQTLLNLAFSGAVLMGSEWICTHNTKYLIRLWFYEEEKYSILPQFFYSLCVTSSSQ